MTDEGKKGVQRKSSKGTTCVFAGRVAKFCTKNEIYDVPYLQSSEGLYKDRLKGVHILLSNSQAGPSRKVKQEQEEISRNHVEAF